jgi:hypothetical protein
MRSARLIAVFAVLSSLLGVAGEKSIGELEARLATAKTGDRPAILVDIARLQLDETSRHYDEGRVGEGANGVAAVVVSLEKASEAARVSGKRLKKTEIAVREIARRMEDLSKTVSFEQRAPLEQAVKRLDELRQELLTEMFGLDSRKKGARTRS